MTILTVARDLTVSFRLHIYHKEYCLIFTEMLVFHSRGNTMSCLFLSRTFHEREKIEEVSLKEKKASLDLFFNVLKTFSLLPIKYDY